MTVCRGPPLYVTSYSFPQLARCADIGVCFQDLLYLLVTDQGFLREPRVVWETLASTDGAGQFVDGNFEPLSPEQPPASSPQQVDHE